MKSDRCRFCRLYAWSVLAFGALVGGVTALQLMFSAARNLRFYASQLLAHGAARSGAAAACGSGLLLALVLWAHPLREPELREDLRRILRRALAVCAPGYLLALVAALAAAFPVAALGLGQTAELFFRGLGVIGWRDLAVGGCGTLLDTLLILFLARRYAARLQAGRMSLPEKLIVVVTVTVPLRATLGLIFSTLLSG